MVSANFYDFQLVYFLTTIIPAFEIFEEICK